MNHLRKLLKEYLGVRRVLGYKSGAYERLLSGFVSFLQQRKSTRITAQLTLQWAQQPRSASRHWWAYRLRVVSGFAKHVAAYDPRTEVPAIDILPYCQRRSQPYIYSETEIAALLKAARRLSSGNGLRRWTYSTIFGLLWATGMRIGEVLALNRGDVDFESGLLTIHETKFGKSRLIPLHHSICVALQRYSRKRDSVFPKCKVPAFFVTIYGTRPTHAIVDMTFLRLPRVCGLRAPLAKKGPRIHDLRHTFAVRTLLRFYKEGLDVERYLYVLSVFLGHVGPASTYWYLSAVPALLACARCRLERQLGGLL